ncbi:thioesterase family protein [Sporosarcina aquimarina]|uniref:Thioesterase family protein n=2 Tax=Sporosarcina aquimarina TaxID=114975 RepID=A0ABU4G0D5_9BACL|nr:thioesterase family protein [Sporosarcina aquimarina]MDW0110430.1 thioesterase family protein [Sporosarcina aquimarina]
MKQTYIEDFKEWEEGFRFSVPMRVRFSETDMFGHLNNTVTFAYFEQARIDYLKSLGLMNDWLDPSGERIPVVADLQCDYMKQVFFDESIDVYVKANSIGRSSVDIHYMAKNAKGEVVFTGRGAMVQISKQTGSGVAWTEEEKELFHVRTRN